MSFAESFDEITNVRRMGLDLFDIANETISLEAIKDNKVEYTNKIKEFGFENVNVAYEEVVTTVLDAICRFFEKLWIAIKSFFSKVVAQQKLYITTMNKKYSAIEKLFKVRSTINISDAKVAECIPFAKIKAVLPRYSTVCKEVFRKVIGFRLYGFIDKAITGVSNDEFIKGIDVLKTLNVDNTAINALGFVVERLDTTDDENGPKHDHMSFTSNKMIISYDSNNPNFDNSIERDKSVSELGYDPKTIRSMIDDCIEVADIIIKNHTLVVNDIQKVSQSVTKVSDNGTRYIKQDESNSDRTIADKCTKAVGICNTFTSMIQAVVFAAGFYNTMVQTTIDKIYDAIKAHVEANLTK